MASIPSQWGSEIRLSRLPLNSGNTCSARLSVLFVFPLLGLVAGCQEDVPPPAGYSIDKGSWCSPDISSARKMGNEAVFKFDCEEGPDSEANRRLAATNQTALSNSITRRFNCDERRIVETTLIVQWKNGPSTSHNYSEGRQVVPNSPLETAMEYACAQ